MHVSLDHTWTIFIVLLVELCSVSEWEVDQRHGVQLRQFPKSTVDSFFFLLQVVTHYMSGHKMYEEGSFIQRLFTFHILSHYPATVT